MDMEKKKNLGKAHFENDLLHLLGVWKHWQTFHSYEADLYKPFPIDSCFVVFFFKKLFCLLICHYRSPPEKKEHMLAQPF